MEQRYKVIFRGEVVPGKTVIEVKQALATLMQARVYQLDTLFSGRAVVIKKDLDSDVAYKYVEAFRDAGAVVELKAQDDEPAAVTAAPAAPSPASRAADPPPVRVKPRLDIEPTVHTSSGDVIPPRRPPSAPVPAAAAVAPAPAAAEPAIAAPVMPVAGAYDDPAYTLPDDYRDRSVGSVIGSLLALLLTLVVTGVLVAALLAVLLWLTGGLQAMGFDDPAQLYDAAVGYSSGLLNR